MKRNIDVLLEIQKHIRIFYFTADELDSFMDAEGYDFADLIECADDGGSQMLCALLNTLEYITQCLDMLTEDLKTSLCNEGFDTNDFMTWYDRVKHDPYYIDGLLESFTEALKVLDFYILETARGYRILTQYSYTSSNVESGDSAMERRTEQV